MKNLTVKTFIGCVALTSMLGLTACQNMGGNMMGDHHKPYMMGMKKEALTDAQIIKVLSTANMGEIMQANTAMPKLQSPQVRAYAQKMIDEHSMNEQRGQALANRLQLMPQVSNTSNMLQMASNDIVTQLNQDMAPTDRKYLMSQVKVHRKVLMTIDNQLLPNSQSPELRAMLMQTRDAVAMHLNMAEQMVGMMR